jgi:hypothetical protein
MAIVNPLFKNKGNIKEQIIDILSLQWPLTAREIFYIITKKLGISITYQGVHKGLKQLLSGNVIKVEKRKYSLDEEWIKSSKEQFNKLEKIYQEKGFDKEILPSKIVFNSYYEMYSFVCDYLSKEDLKTNGEPIIFTDKHWWNLFVMTEEQLTKLDDFSKKYEFYCVGKCNTPLDLMLMNFYKKQGMHCKNSDIVKTDQGTIVVGDVFIQIFYPDNLRRIMSEIAESTTNFESMDLKRMQQELVYKKNEIIFLIHQDKILSDRTRKEVIGYFSISEKK